MPPMDSIGPFEHLVLEAVAAVQIRAYGSCVYEKACELAGLFTRSTKLLQRDYDLAKRVEKLLRTGR